METVQAFGKGNNRIAAGRVTLTPAQITADPVAAGDLIAAAVTGTIVTVSRDSAAAAVNGALAVILTRGTMTIGKALRVYLSDTREARDAGGNNAATIGYLSEDRFVTITAEDVAEDVAPRTRSFRNGATITATAAGVTLTLATGETVQGMQAAILAQGYALAEASEAAHGSAAAARGAANSAAATVTDARLGELVREHGETYGGAAIIAEAMGWITADSTKAQRLAAMNRARVAISRMKRRTGGEDHSTRA